MDHRKLPASLVARSDGIMGALAALLSNPHRLLPFRQRGLGVMNIARPVPLILAVALVALTVALTVFPASAQSNAPTDVPSDWSLVPSGLNNGDEFRLLFLTSGTRDATSSSIGTYNAFVQNAAANGHAVIQAYRSGFRAVGSTRDDDARDNTATTYTAGDKGVPIYWLGGNRLADDYEDFHDGSWDDEDNVTNESGTSRPFDSSASGNRPFEGSDHDGTGDNPNELGESNVRVGRPNDSGSGRGPINGGFNTERALNRPFYGLSAVFRVEGELTPALSIEAGSGEEGGNVTFTARLSPMAAQDVTATWTASVWSGDTAVLADDLGSMTTGRLTVKAGETTGTFTVPTAQDNTDEENETFTVTLTDPSSNTLIAEATAQGTINDDAPPVLSVAAVDAEEGDGLTFTVTLSAVSGREVTVDWEAATLDAEGDDAKDGTDYTAGSGTLTFAPEGVAVFNELGEFVSHTPGEARKTFTVATIEDTDEEENETFTVTLSNASNASIAEATAKGMIRNDDATLGALPALAQAQTVVRGPYLQSGTPSSVIIKWRTGEATDSVVRYGLDHDPDGLTQSATNSTSTTEHAVQLTGLSPGVKYFYSVGSSSALQLAGGDSDHFFVTAPVPGTAKPTRIWVIGDSGTADANARAVRNAFLEFTGSRDPDLWIMLGDNAYYHGTDNDYRKAVFNTYPQVLPKTVLWPTLGNHDADTADSTTESGPYYDIFSLPRNGEAGGVASGTEAYYSFDYGNLHFVCLNSETDPSPPDGAMMMTWLEADLAANEKEWIIAFWHRAPYSKGSADSDEEPMGSWMRQNAVPILERYGVDLVLAGHSHSYERSYLIDGHYGLSDTFTDVMKKSPGDGSATGDGAYRKPVTVGTPHAGTVYVVAGTAGVIKTGGPLDHPTTAVSFRTLGSMVLDVNGNRLDAMFLDSTGNIRDDFTILKVLNVAPTFRSSATISVLENQTAAGTVEATDDDADDSITGYAITGGADRSFFSIGATSGELTFKTVPNIEDAQDQDAGNDYVVEVTATSGTGTREKTATQTITVKVTDTILTWSATLTVGEDTSVIPRTSGYSAWGMDGTLSTDTFTRGGKTYRVGVLTHKSDGLVLVVDRKLQADFTLVIGDARYERGDGSRPSTKFTDAYWWEARDWTWTAGDGVGVSLTLASGSEATLPELPLAPPTAWFRLTPENHNGVDEFTFRLHFSEDIATGREDFRDHSLEVTGGSVTGLERVNGLNRLWEITVAPDPTGDVTVALPAGVACEVAGAICTADGRELHNRPEFTVAGPEPVSEQPPDDEEPPADELTAVWSATMTVEWVHWGWGYYSTSAKQAGSLSPASFEVDGTTYTVTMIETRGWMYIGFDRQLPFGFVLELDGARFASDDASFQSYSYGNLYQWRGTDLSWNDGDTVEVRLLPTAPDGRATGAPTISGTAMVGETLTANASGIADPDGLAGASFAYQWMALGRDIDGADGPGLTLTRDEVGRTIRVRVSFTDDAGNMESLTSEPTAAVAARPNNRATGAPSISGMARVNRVLRAHTSGIADPDGMADASFAYQWTAGGSDIDGAAGASLTLTPDMAGRAVGVRVSFTDDARYRETRASLSTMPVQPASECPGAGSGPAPRSIAVGSVPVVVESTAEKYYVLYVRHQLNGETAVEIPVSVTLGQDGTTTLSEQLSPLPPERYRVDEFLVAEPGDLDGDCVDDIAELGDPAGMNPLNPAPAVKFVDGVVAIPDRETFEALSYQGRRVVIDTHLRGLEFVKFYLFRMDTDRPVVYFMNTETHRAHSWFGNVIGLWHNPLWLQGAMKGEIVYHPNVVAPDGSLGVYRFEFEPQDAYAFEAVAYAYEVLAASMPLLDDNYAYYPMPARALPLYHEERALFDDSRVNVLLEEDIFPDVDFISLNKAEGYGFLRVMALEERPNPRDVVIYETLPNELSRVAGIITTVPQTPLSHVNLRAVQDGVPNAFIRDALDDDDIDDLLDSYVHYTVAGNGWTLRAATPAEVDAHYAASRPSQDQTPQRDLGVTQITALSDIGFGDWTAFGVKAANVAVLGTLGFEDGTVPEGFAVPFYFYDEFMKHNGFYDDIADMLADPDFQSDFDTQESELKKLRKRIKKGETPQWIIEALQAMHATYPEGQSLRYRSSTNNEDLPGFSGAGLYDSKTQDPDETAEDGIDKSIKGVWASMWNFRAFTEREFHRIDHLVAAMGVLVHPNYSDELANGVAVSFDPFGRRDGSYYINTQLGEDLITNPEAHSTPEEMLLHPDGTYTITARSNQVPAGRLLMSDAQLGQLRRHLEAIHDEFEELYGIGSGQEFAMEIEFKITSENILSIKQARPWVFSSGQVASGAEGAPPEHSNRLATGAPAINGSARVGETLTVDIARIADEDGLDNVAFAYQWQADDADINGATGATYTLIDAEEGKAIKVEVNFTDDAGNRESLTSGATDAVAAAPNPNSPATGAPTITGTAQVGETLTADTSGIDDADGLSNVQYEYQWLADDSGISGATNATYTLAGSEENRAIKVQVSFTDDAGHNETLTSAATDVVAGAQPMEPPDKPTGLDATATHDSVTLTWDDPQDESITGYVILRRIPGVDPEGHFDVLVANTGSAATTYTDDTVSAETRYTYRIKAINGAGTSERSRWVHIDVPAPPVPDKPTGLEATESNGQWSSGTSPPATPRSHGVERPGGPHLGRPRRRLHHRLRDTAPRAGEQYRGRFQCIGRGHGHGRHHLHRRHGGGRHHLHLPDQGHQRARNKRAVPLVPHRHPGGPVAGSEG